MRTALVIMAAGIGSRFGGGIKQLTPIGPNGELIIDYSIHDALEAGFNEVVFIIRRELEAEVRRLVGDRLEAGIGTLPNLDRVRYVYQDMEDLPDGFDQAALAAARTKPWGTGHAILACRKILDIPFAVINADDYYGKKAFKSIHYNLIANAGQPGHYCMAGFVLKNTLSKHGGVTRGICQLSGHDYLRSVQETRNLVLTGDCAAGDTGFFELDSVVSMNMWGFNPDFLDILEQNFRKFIENKDGKDLTTEEYLLPTIVGEELKKGTIQVRCLRTEDHWFGVTYQEDKQVAEQEIRDLITVGVYPRKLY